jgi:cbb3-type cytochrome oxidase maturation protein
MGIIYVMLVVSLLIALFFLISFIWAVKSNQFEDDYSPSVRILFEDEINTTKEEEDGNREV